MTLVNRREFMSSGLAAVGATVGLSSSVAAESSPAARMRLGMVIHTYMIRSAAATPDSAAFSDPLNFLEHCRKLGAGGIQVSIGRRDREYIGKLRAAAESAGMYVEASIRLPRDGADVQRFAAEAETAREAGATVLRTVCLSGRRYEVFDTSEAFQKFARQARESIALAEPVVARHKMRLAVENHKDWRIDEHLDIIRRLSSAHVGVCVDTGNSIALLEDPYCVIEQYAKHAFTVHLKDMAVAEYDQGFLLAEVPLGAGFLDLPRMIAMLRRVRPEIRFNLEMITRDPLKIPCLTDKYWATFQKAPGDALARTLALVRRHAAKQPLLRISQLSLRERLAIEERNNRESLAYAKYHLKL